MRWVHRVKHRDGRVHRLVVLLAVVGAVAVIWTLSIGPEARAVLEPEALAARLRAAGASGALGLLVLLVVQCVVAPIPSEPIMLAAGFVYGHQAALALCWIGVCAGAALCYLLARRFGRPLAERLVRAEALAAFDARLAARGLVATFAVVLGLRLFAFPSFDVLSYACGLLRFPLPWFLAATGIGALPKILAFTYAGAAVGARPGWLDLLIVLGTFGALVLLPWVARRRRPASPR
jgi:uncharacterized membrane protein YdjX (TVP38/TMEM64 family)